MAILDFLRRKASATGSVIFTGNGDVKWSPRDYGAFAKEGYVQNVIANASIKKVAKAVASVEWEAWQGDTQLTESPFLDLINNPSPTVSKSEFMEAHISYELIAGNAYMEKVDLEGVPKELFTLRPDRMTIKEGPGGIPSAFVYKVGGKKFTWEVDPVTGESDIWHFKSFNPVDDWYGMAPTEPAAYAIDQHNESMKWVQALLQNSARPSGAVVVESKDGQSNTLSDDGYNRLKTQIEEQYSGSRNAGRPMLLDGGLKWQAMGLSPSDMSILETKAAAARDIALAYGVPPQMLGIPGDNTYANYKEARCAFWEDTVIPLVENTKDELNSWLGPKFGNTELRPNMDKIPAIVEKRMDLWGMADESEDLTIDERRALKGYDELPDGEGAKLQERVVRQQDKPTDDVKALSPTMKAAFAYGSDYGKQ